MQTTTLYTAEALLDRLKRAYGLRNDAELARHLGLSSSSAIGNWRRRDTFDIKVLMERCSDLNLDWVIYGRGPMRPFAYTTSVQETFTETVQEPTPIPGNAPRARILTRLDNLKAEIEKLKESVAMEEEDQGESIREEQTS